ncbi:hypothetical protein GRJ2_003447900 [Grus japonensis]|uniref:RNase H type-1 domain-containing protein n=1 Tax=Grus japonensis TaxID=30415 RepID=A0ABC9YJS3_GRUJA
MPSSHEGAEPISISGVTGGSQQLTLLEAEVSLTGNECEKHPIVTGPEALCILGIDYLRRGYFKDPKGYLWAFGIAALEVKEIELFSGLPCLSEDPSVVGLLRVEEQQVPIATTTVHQQQYCTNRDSLVPIHKLIRQLEVAIGPVQAGPDVKNVLYTAARENGPTWSLWQKAPGETRGRPLGFWSRGYRGSEARYTPTEKEILAAYEGVRAASEVIGTEAQLLLAPRLPVLGWMFKGRAPSTHHATNATWSKWVALITQWARIGSPNHPGILELITDWPEGKDFGMSPEEEVTRAEEAPPYNKLTEDEKPYALFTDGSCHIVGKHQRWKPAVWSPTRQVAEAAEGEGESSHFAEVKAIQLALDIAEREKWPTLYLYTDSWMVANALWGWLQQWKQSNWQRRGKPIWAAPLWQDIAARLEELVVKVRDVDAHVPKSWATEEHQNNQQVDQAAKTEVAQVDLDWQPKGELFIAWWAHDTSGHQGRDGTYRWAHDRGVDLSMDAISQVIENSQ